MLLSIAIEMDTVAIGEEGSTAAIDTKACTVVITIGWMADTAFIIAQVIHIIIALEFFLGASAV
jgi:hypothetical protein